VDSSLPVAASHVANLHAGRAVDDEVFDREPVRDFAPAVPAWLSGGADQQCPKLDVPEESAALAAQRCISGSREVRDGQGFQENRSLVAPRRSGSGKTSGSSASADRTGCAFKLAASRLAPVRPITASLSIWRPVLLKDAVGHCSNREAAGKSGRCSREPRLRSACAKEVPVSSSLRDSEFAERVDQFAGRPALSTHVESDSRSRLRAANTVRGKERGPTAEPSRRALEPFPRALIGCCLRRRLRIQMTKACKSNASTCDDTKRDRPPTATSIPDRFAAIAIGSS